MKCLIIGYGSIGKRHAQILSHLNHEIFVVTQQNINEYASFRSIEDALQREKLSYIVIANSTDLHQETLEKLQRLSGKILVEKPIISKYTSMSLENERNIFTGYNLRFHRILMELKKRLSQEELISFSARVGQYLPQWRLERSYKESYSADENRGGGVLRDLSHELDYSTWICGECIDVTALGGHWSELEINSDDNYTVMMRCKRCPSVTIYMDYLSRTPYREIRAQTKTHTYYADLIKNTWCMDETMYSIESVNTYEQQHLAILTNNFQQVCSYQEGMSVVRLIHAIEAANKTRQWIEL